MHVLIAGWREGDRPEEGAGETLKGAPPLNFLHPLYID